MPIMTNEESGAYISSCVLNVTTSYSATQRVCFHMHDNLGCTGLKKRASLKMDMDSRTHSFFVRPDGRSHLVFGGDDG